MTPPAPTPDVLANARTGWRNLHPNTWNPNKMDERTYQAAVESIQTFGFIDPLTVRKHPTEGDDHFEIIDGFHRWKAAGDLLGQDVELPIIVLKVSDTGARKLTIILNETRGEADPVLLGTLLAELNAELDPDELRLGLRYDDAEFEHLLSLADVDWDKFAPASKDHDAPPSDPTDWTTISARIPMSVLPVWEAAIDRVKDQTDLHADPEIMAGQVVEILSASYLAE